MTNSFYEKYTYGLNEEEKSEISDSELRFAYQSEMDSQKDYQDWCDRGGMS